MRKSDAFVSRSLPVVLALLLVLAAPAGAQSTVGKAARQKQGELEKRFRGEFRYRFEEPWLLVGNITAPALDSFAEHTVKAPVSALRRQLFPKLPDRLITIYLLKDDATYRLYARELFGDEPSTPYGYVRGDAMIMNIGTGGGTLVHELVHSLMAANFPSAPPWLNEGLGSLFEQCSIEEERLVGRTNWRLPALQDALDDGTLVPLTKLLALTATEFYGAGSGLHYAQARYLCMYLQQRGVLELFYRSFRDDFAGDGTGGRALEKVTGLSLEALDAEWRTWVGGLTWQ